MGSYTEHQELLKKSIIEAQRHYPSMRFFQRHVGLYYTKQGTPIRMGIEGQSDVYAYVKSQQGIMVIEIEFKTGKSQQSKEQKAWQDYIEQNNGNYLLIRETKELLYELGRIHNSLSSL